jgi:hypothetical protein
MVPKPFPQSYWVHDGLLCAGCYPGDLDPATRDAKLGGLLDCGIRRVISLMEPGETDYCGRPFEPYVPRLNELAAERGLAVECLNMPVRDASVPNPAVLREVLAVIGMALERREPLYLHCWGGHGRTGTVVACHLIREGYDPWQAIAAVERLRADLPKNHYPFAENQVRFILSWPVGVRRAGGASRFA